MTQKTKEDGETAPWHPQTHTHTSVQTHIQSVLNSKSIKLTTHPYLMPKLRKMELNFHFLIQLHAMVHIKKALEFLNKVTHIQVP